MGRGVEDKTAYAEYAGVFEYLHRLYWERRHEYSIMLPTKTPGAGYYWKYYYIIKDQFKEEYPSGTTEYGFTVYDLCTEEYRSRVFYTLTGSFSDKEELTKYDLRKAKKLFDARFDAIGYMLAVANGCSDMHTEGRTHRPDMTIVYDLLEDAKETLENRLVQTLLVTVTVDMIDRVLDRLRRVIDARGIDVLPNEIREYIRNWDDSIWTDKYVELLEVPKIFDRLD